jgi:hypothetical protein
MSSGYDVAQVCINGHVANSSSQDFPQFNKKYCDECGAPTIIDCPNCHTSIRGNYRESLSIDYKPPRFCFNCGHPFPWTAAKIQAAHDLTLELENLSQEDRQMLDKSIDDLIKDSPATSVAATRFKKIMLKAGAGTAAMFREILVDVASEAAKKMLFS